MYFREFVSRSSPREAGIRVTLWHRWTPGLEEQWRTVCGSKVNVKPQKNGNSWAKYQNRASNYIHNQTIHFTVMSQCSRDWISQLVRSWIGGTKHDTADCTDGRVHEAAVITICSFPTTTSIFSPSHVPLIRCWLSFTSHPGAQGTLWCQAATHV